MILFQVRDLAAKSCGEPHVAPSFEIAKASLGALLAKNSELGARAASLRVEYICDWDPSTGAIVDRKKPLYRRMWSKGDTCLAEFRRALQAEEQTADAGFNFAPGLKGEEDGE